MFGPAPTPGAPRFALAHFVLPLTRPGLCCLQDILWIQKALAGDASDQLTLTRSARLARVGARAARLARMARVLRVLKLMKLMLLVKMRRNVPVDEEVDLDAVPKAIQDSVSEKVTRRVVMIVLFSVIGSAGLQYYEEDLAASAAFLVIAAATTTSVGAQTTVVAEAVPDMYYLEVTTFGDPLIDRRSEQKYLDLRSSETTKYITGPDDACVNCAAWVDTSANKVEKAVRKLVLLSFLCIYMPAIDRSLSPTAGTEHPADLPDHRRAAVLLHADLTRYRPGHAGTDAANRADVTHVRGVSNDEMFCINDDGFCINDDGFCINDDGFCITNVGICVKNDEF